MHFFLINWTLQGYIAKLVEIQMPTLKGAYTHVTDPLQIPHPCTPISFFIRIVLYDVIEMLPQGPREQQKVGRRTIQVFCAPLPIREGSAHSTWQEIFHEKNNVK